MNFTDMEVFEMHRTFEKHLLKSKNKTTIVELKYRYAVLKEIAISGTKYKKGDYVFLNKSSFKEGLMVLAKDQSARDGVIRKIKKYLDERYNGDSVGFYDVEFNNEFSKIKIFPLPVNEQTT